MPMMLTIRMLGRIFLPESTRLVRHRCTLKRRNSRVEHSVHQALIPRAMWLLILLVCGTWLCVGGIYTDFDLVRPFAGAWGSTGTTAFIKINALNNNGPNVTSFSRFGYSVAVIGDMDGNGVDDLAVGAIGEDVFNHTSSALIANAGSVYILFMNQNGSVLNSTRISSEINGGPSLKTDDRFGFSIAALGDLDGDGTPDIAVGAPGVLVASVYVLYLNNNGSVNSYGLIRGKYVGVAPTNVTSIVNGTEYVINGPPIRYGSQFGYAIAALDDMNGDGVIELAVSALDISGGYSRVHILYMSRNSTVLSYATVGPNLNGGPELTRTFTGFGSALLGMPDFDGDNVSELVVGSRFLFDAGSENVRAGKAFFCFLFANGTIKSSQPIGELSLGEAQPMPSVPYDECGTSLASIGDINRDNYKQRRPSELADPPRPSVPDFITGCPQTGTGTLPGRFFLMFLSTLGSLRGFKAIPGETDIDGQGGGHRSGPRVAPELNRVDGFGQSLAGYWDIDGNGLREIVVGAPGDDANGTASDSGAIYIMFLRRRRHHWIPFDWVTYWVTIFVPTGCFCCSCVSGIAFFFYYFRRRPDEVEVIVKKSGYQMAQERKRYMKGTNQVYADNYTA